MATRRLCCISLLAILSLFASFPPASTARSESERADARAAGLEAFDLISEYEGWVLVAGRLYWTADAGTSWNDITPADLGASTIRAAFFFDRQHGWLAVASPLWPSAATGGTVGGPLSAYAIARTSDGGRTWQTSQVPLGPDDLDLLAGRPSLYFLDTQAGWLAIKRTGGSNFSLGALWKTADGGDTWTRLSLPIGEPVYFVTNDLGWTAGGATGGELYRTADGGRTWQPVALGAPTAPGEQRFYRLPVFDNPREGVLPVLVMGEDGTRIELYETADGGRTWRLATSLIVSQEPIPDGYLPLAAVNSRDWILAVPGTQNLIRLSATGQAARIASPNALAAGIQELRMSTLKTGWARYAAGSCSAPPAGSPPGMLPECHQEVRLLRTVDGGQTWSSLSLPGPTPLGIEDMLVPGSAGTRPEQSGVGGHTELFIGHGFDKCEIATLAQLTTWAAFSPYRAVNLYIGGSCRACSNSALTAALLTQIRQQGWRFIPTWVGPQSACWGGGCDKFSNDPATAYAQGISEADQAVAAAVNLGLASPDGSGAIIYYDLESYSTGNPACRAAASALISGWIARLHERGSQAGVYGSGCSSALGDFANIENVPDAVWPAHWVGSTYNPDATVWDVLCLSNDLWSNHQRIRQYTGGHQETWGGTTLSIDCDVLDGVVADIGSSTCCGCGSATGQSEPAPTDPDFGVTPTPPPAAIASVVNPTPIPARPQPVLPQSTPPAGTSPASAHYRMVKSVAGSGGGPQSSASYALNGTLGQASGLRRRHSAGYVLVAGYWGKWIPDTGSYVYVPLVLKGGLLSVSP